MPDPILTLTTTDNGKTYDLPKARIATAQDARDIVATYRRAEQQWRSKRRAKINGCLNGNRPWSQAKQIAQGRADQTNFNLRTGEGFVAAAKGPYYDLVFEVDRFAQFEIDFGDDTALQQEWADKIGSRYHQTLDDWDGMDAAFQRSQYQMVVHGAGPMMWEDERDWRSKSRMAGQILLPDDASADVEEWETAAIPRSYSPSELWKEIRNEATATAAKWNVPYCKQAIMRAAPDDLQKTLGNTWEHWEAEIRKGAVGFDNKSKRIFVADVLQKEFTGRISHMIILDTGIESALPSNDPNTGYAPSEKDGNIGFLFRKIGRFECFSHIVNGFTYDVGPDGQWHSIKGAGPKILDFCDVENRLTCRMVDGAMQGSGMVVRAKNVKALQETAMTYIAGGVALHPDYEVEQVRISDNLQSPLLVKRDLKVTLDGNTGNYRQRMDGSNHEPTARQAELNAAHAATLGKGDVNRYNRFLDRWHRETVRRLLLMGERLCKNRTEVAPIDYENKSLSLSEQGAVEFYEGCISDGVPKEALQFKYFRRIKATRTVGNGSAQMRMMIADKFIAGVSMMDERSRNTAQRMWASAYGGQTAADLLFPRYGTPQMVDAQVSLATMENNFLRMPNSELAVSPDQNHVVHFQIHRQGVATHAQEIQQGQSDPMSLLVHLDNAGPHMHEHLNQIAGDPTRKVQVQQMTEEWLELSKMADQLRQQIEEAQAAAEANQPEQGPDPELIAKLAEVQGKTAVMREGMLLKHRLQMEKERNSDRRKDIAVAAKIRRDNSVAAQVEPMAA